MTDAIFDIDGTLANAEHRLHYITPPLDQFEREHFKKDWDSFLSNEEMAKDTAIPQIWTILESLLHRGGNRVIFITGRPQHTRNMTMDWFDRVWPRSVSLVRAWSHAGAFPLFMRFDGDRRPSHEVKEDLLKRARWEGYDPTLVFEDRDDDTAMWRRNGLLCCQVAEGNY